jgi:putative addiction module antidote
MMKLEVRRIGNSTGVILPKELTAKLDLKQGQWLYVTELPDGGIRLTPYDPDFEKAMEVVEDLMVEYRDTLKALAK